LNEAGNSRLKHRPVPAAHCGSLPETFLHTRTRTAPPVASKQAHAHAHEDTRFRVLKLLQEQPHLKQRELAEKLGVSLGKTNYCLRALLEKGQLSFMMRGDAPDHGTLPH
jgi:hypothetical protein